MIENIVSSRELISHLSTVFSGRENELRHLNSLFAKMMSGSGSFVVITGEAGTGKTALVRNFVNGVRKEGIRFISETFKGVANYEPYAPFLKIIAKLGGSNIQELMKRVWDGDLTNRTVCDSKRTNVNWNMESLYSLQAEQGLAQQQLVTSLLEASKNKPLIIALTDVHLASLSAWQFIHYLTHGVIDHSIMILITLRQDGKVMNHEKIPLYADVLQRMNRERLIEKINLNRFNQNEIRKFIRAAFQRTDFSNTLLPLLSEVTGGLPQQLCHILQKMVENNIIYEQDNIWFNKEAISKDQLFELLRDDMDLKEISQLIRNIDILHRTLLEYGALFDGKLDHRILSLVLNISPIKVLKELQDFVDRKILIATSDGEYQFKKPAVQSYLLERITPGSRNSLHQEIGKAVEQAIHLEKSKKIYLLAYHFSRTKDIKSAIQYLHQAGDNALQHLAFSESREYYRQAIKLLSNNLVESSKDELIGMLLKAAWVGRVLGDRKWSLACCETARRLKNGNTDKSLDGQIMLHEGFNYLKLNKWKKAKKCFDSVLDTNSYLSDFNKSLANYGLGTLYFELADYDMAKKYFEISLEIAKILNSDKLIATTLNHLGALENVRGKSIKAITLYSQSIPLFQRIDDQAGLAQIYHNIGMTHAEEQGWQAANDFYGKSLAISDTMGLLPLKSITFLNRALALAYLAKFEDAEEYNFKALRLLHQLNDELGLAEYHKIQGVILREKRVWAEAEIEFKTAIEKYYKLENKLGIAETEFEWAKLAKRKKEKEKEQYWANRCLKSFQKLGIDSKINLIKKEFFNVKRYEMVEI